MNDLLSDKLRRLPRPINPKGELKGAPKHGTTPIVIDETPGKKAICRGRRTGNSPWCHGTHAKSV